MPFAMEIPYLVAPPQEAEYPADPHNSELLPQMNYASPQNTEACQCRGQTGLP